MLNHKKFMIKAIKSAYDGKAKGENPFGCVVVGGNGKIVATAHDTVKNDNDLTSHSETNAIKIAIKKLGRDLSSCIVYTTCEPCPMCFGAIWLSKIKTIVFGSYMYDIDNASNGKVRVLNISVEKLNQMSGSENEIIKEIMRDECINLWKNLD